MDWRIFWGIFDSWMIKLISFALYCGVKGDIQFYRLVGRGAFRGASVRFGRGVGGGVEEVCGGPEDGGGVFSGALGWLSGGLLRLGGG